MYMRPYRKFCEPRFPLINSYASHTQRCAQRMHSGTGDHRNHGIKSGLAWFGCAAMALRFTKCLIYQKCAFVLRNAESNMCHSMWLYESMLSLLSNAEHISWCDLVTTMSCNVMQRHAACGPRSKSAAALIRKGRHREEIEVEFLEEFLQEFLEDFEFNEFLRKFLHSSSNFRLLSWRLDTAQPGLAFRHSWHYVGICWHQGPNQGPNQVLWIDSSDLKWFKHMKLINWRITTLVSITKLRNVRSATTTILPNFRLCAYRCMSLLSSTSSCNSCNSCTCTMNFNQVSQGLQQARRTTEKPLVRSCKKLQLECVTESVTECAASYAGQEWYQVAAHPPT